MFESRMALKGICLSLVLSLGHMVLAAEAPAQAEDMEQGWDSRIHSDKSKETLLEEWRDLGFGIFIHWSASTVFQGRHQGKELQRDLWGEWFLQRTRMDVSDYKDALRTWGPSHFNADEWADLIESSGFKHMVYIAKHHDGFAMFDGGPFSITRFTPFQRDPFRELCAALQAKGIKTGFYYSHGTDWINKRGFEGTKAEIDEAYFQQTVKPHLTALCENYGPQVVAWFDLGWSPEMAKKCADVIHGSSPDTLISSRIGGGIGDFKIGGDCQVPVVAQDEPWETCMTMDHHWAWYPQDKDHKSPAEIIHMLARIRSRGGNLLLNIGPDIRGEIPLREQATLRQVGDWLAINGESIYGTRSTPYADLPWGVCTAGDGMLYLHVLTLPSVDTLFLPGLASPVKRVSFVGDQDKTAIPFTRTAHGIEIDLLSAVKTPGLSQYFSDINTVLRLEYGGELQVDGTPVLDQDLDTVLIPQLASSSSRLTLKHTRTTPTIEHPGCEEPRYDYYAYGFGKADAKVEWNYHAPRSGHYYVDVNYANLTDETLVAALVVNGQALQVELPPTKSQSRPWEVFSSAVSTGLQIAQGDNQTLSFGLQLSEDHDSLNQKTRQVHNVMLKHIALRPALPALYKGYR
jgi:hypothetical protein